MNVVVTGGTGFLGKHVVRELRSHDYQVLAAGRSTGYDLTTKEGRSRLFATKPDAVIHLAAAVGGIGANVAEPGRFFYVNAVMGMELIELARLHRTPKFVTVGTACEYPDDAPVPLRENWIWDGYPAPATARYGLAKRMLLEMGQAYREQYGMNVTHLLPTNLYGPEDNFALNTGHVIPSLIKKFSDAVASGAEDVACWGTGYATRDFLYVTDAARAIRLALENYNEAEPVNLGAGVETPVRDVVNMVARETGYTGIVSWDSSKPEGAGRRYLDTERAQRYLGFTPQVSLAEGVARTAYWYRRSQ